MDYLWPLLFIAAWVFLQAHFLALKDAAGR